MGLSVLFLRLLVSFLKLSVSFLRIFVKYCFVCKGSMTNNNNKKEKLTTSKTIKTVLFAGLLAAMILPFSAMDVAEAQTDKKNPKDKTLERIQEKNDRELILKKTNELDAEENDLKEKIKSEKNESEKQKINKRLNEIKSELDKIDKKNHEKDIPQAQMEKLISQQDAFEEKLIDSDVIEFVTSVGIDITSKEIQVGINQDIVSSDNIDTIVSDLEKIMPKNAKWHVVYSDTVELLSCNQDECDPIIGGNKIRNIDGDKCSYGFQAKKGSVWGWITAGHCVDGLVGSLVKDHSYDIIGAVNAENFYWGTYCDCAWITDNTSNPVDNKVYLGSQYTITKTTPASGQQNDRIYKSGQQGGVDSGYVSALHVTVIDFGAGYYVRDLVRSNAAMDHGDSGGTIVEYYDKHDLYGIVAAHDWWGNYHTPIDRIVSDMNITPVLN